MAEEQKDQVSPGSIPPKAVPPQIRPATEGSVDSPTVRRQAVAVPGGTAVPVPRTVRLKPITVTSADATVDAAPAGASSATAAAEAVKRMTARIAMLADESDAGKKRTGQLQGGGGQDALSSGAPLPAVGVSDAAATFKKVTTSRIQMSSATGPIPEMPDAPRTIKIRPQSPTQTGLPAVPPTASESPTVVSSASNAQQVPGKTKTSRIPLESAMSVPPPSEPPSEDQAGVTPKTIKLKRPGEMSTVKVSVHGGVQAGAESTTDNTPITQKKTIRVRRPMTPAAASVADGVAVDEAGAPVMTPIAYVPPATESGTGWFIAVSVACILLILGLTGLFAVQLFGSRPHTELDPQYQKG